MYYAMILGLMLILPLVSTVGEAMMLSNADVWAIAIKWFVFWGVGVRLGLAGLRQVMRPSFTARDIFEIEDPAANKIVVELGFWNLSIGLVAILTLFWPGWAVPVAIAAGLFYGLAGLQHLQNTPRTMKENGAMASDLFMFAALAILVAKAVLWP